MTKQSEIEAGSDREVGGVGRGGPCSPCARGSAREWAAWQAGLWEAPAPAALEVAVEVEVEAVLETGPLHATKHTQIHK